MKVRALASFLAVAAVVVGGIAFSGAAFTAISADPGNSFAASNAFNLTATMTDPGAYLHATVPLQANASDGEDGSSISSVTIQKSPAGAGTWTNVCTVTSFPYSCPFDTTGVSDGLYDFRAFAQNNLGASATSSVVANRLVDNTAPTASMTDPGTPLHLTVTLDASGTDTGGSGVANVKIQRSPAGVGIWTDICTDSSSPYQCVNADTATWGGDGLYDLRSITTDNANNTTTSATVANRRVDNTAPTATMTNPGSPITGNKSFDGTASDTGSGVGSLTFQVSPTGLNTWSDMCSDNSSPYACSYDTSALADGQYDFRSLATDNAMNTATSTVYSGAIVDNAAPTATMNDPGQYLHGTTTLDATAGDGAGSGVANVKIQRSPAGLGIWTDVCTDSIWPYQCTGVNTATWGDGLYDLRAIATDNVSKSTTSATVTDRRVDNTAPTSTMTDPGPYLVGTNVTLDASGTDTGGSGVANVKIQRSPAGLGIWTDVCTDSIAPYQCTGVDTTTWGGDGLYDLRAITTDNATNSTTSATVANRRVDNTVPTATMNDPGSPMHGLWSFTASGSDTGSGFKDIKIQRSPAGLGIWTDICTSITSPLTCNNVNTVLWGDGVYDIRALVTDNAGNTNTSVVANRTVDNTAPTATNIQTGVTGTTAGLAQTGDTLVFTFSEQIAPGTIVAGWNGTGTRTVTVTLDTGNHLSIAGATLVNGFITLGGAGYVNAGKTVVFSNSTISQAGAVVTLTLGTPDKPQFLNTGSAGQTSWPVAAALTDLATNAITTVTRLEVTPPNDPEF